jgi:hypothetical protein
MNVTPVPPGLLQQITAGKHPRILVLGLHRGAGKRTVVEGLAREAAAAGTPMGIASAPRLVRDDDYSQELPTILPLPAGTVVLTAQEAFPEGGAALSILQDAGMVGSLGELVVARVEEDGEVALFGPSEPESISAVTELLKKNGAPQQVVTAGREHQAFLRTGLFDGVVLSAGMGIAPSEERAVAAIGYAVDALDLTECDPRTRTSYQVACSRNEIVVADIQGRVLSTLTRDPLAAARWITGGDAPSTVTVIVPGKLTDELVRALVQAGMSGTFVAEDVTRIRVAPIYFKAWLKGGGEFRVVHPTPLLAVALNPHDPVSGVTAGSPGFLEKVGGLVSPVPVHDVVHESLPAGKRRSWKFWSRTSD